MYLFFIFQIAWVSVVVIASMFKCVVIEDVDVYVSGLGQKGFLT